MGKVTLTAAQMRRAVYNVGREHLEGFVGAVNKYGAAFGIDTPMRLAHFVAQVLHETGGLKTLEENLNYSAKGLRQVFPKYFTEAQAAAYARHPELIANRVYANRLGNRDESSGDGWRYRGRGCIQLTGRANYRAYGQSRHCVGDVANHPEWLGQMPGAAKSAMWYWQQHGCNALADKDDVEAVTRRVNGGLNGLAQRGHYLRRMKLVLEV